MCEYVFQGCVKVTDLYGVSYDGLHLCMSKVCACMYACVSRVRKGDSPVWCARRCMCMYARVSRVCKGDSPVWCALRWPASMYVKGVCMYVCTCVKGV